MNVILEGLDIKPGHRVLLSTVNDWDPNDAKQLIDTLGQRFPDTEFTILTGMQVVTANWDNEIIQGEIDE